MTLQEFIPGMERLRSVFGEKLYPEARVKIFFDELRGMDSRLWLSVVDRLVKEELKPPMMKEIRAALSAEKAIFWDREKRQEKKEAEQAFDGKNLFTHEGFAKHPIFGKVLPIKKLN